jgi:hypothetical protein
MAAVASPLPSASGLRHTTVLVLSEAHALDWRVNERARAWAAAREAERARATGACRRGVDLRRVRW